MSTDVANTVEQDKDREAFVDVVTGGKRKASDTTNNNTNPKKTQKKQRTPITKCKWCGSKSHKTKRSKQCPYNKNNPNPPPDPTAGPPNTALASTESSNTAPGTTASTNTEPTAKYAIGDNVLGMWSRNKWFLAHVTGLTDDKYELYFPADGKTKTVKANRVKPVKRTKNGLHVYKRGDMLNRVFFDDGKDDEDAQDMAPGMWQVRSTQGNEYLCLRSQDCKNKDATPNSLRFDIGYVIEQISKTEQNERNKK